MTTSTFLHPVAFCPRPLAACLALALTAASATASAEPASGDALQVVHRFAQRLKTDGLAHAAAWQRARQPLAWSAPPGRAPATQTVSNCNDSGSGSLRTAVANAVDGDTVSMSQLTCSLISLTSGPIAIHVDNLTMVGRGQQALTIDGGNHSGVLTHYGSGTLAVSDLTLTHGYYGFGGCIASVGSISLTRTTVTSCTSTGYSGVSAGGGVFAAVDLTLTSSIVSNNTAWDPSFSGDTSYGGGAFAARNAAIIGSTISANTATTAGAYAGGGGVLTIGSMSVVTSTISGNTAIDVVAPDAVGGGVAVGADAGIVASTFDDNHASVGGGVSILSATAAFVTVDSTIANNDAAAGGGIATLPAMFLDNSTVAFNYSGGGTGGAGIIIGANSDMESSIVANNNAVGADAGADISGGVNVVVVSGASNLVMHADSDVTLPAGTLRVDPMLASFLENNGGPTQTLALNANSPAIDAGNNVANLASDQRGFARVAGLAADIGAYELQTEGDEIFASGFESPGVAF